MGLPTEGASAYFISTYDASTSFSASGLNSCNGDEAAPGQCTSNSCDNCGSGILGLHCVQARLEGPNDFAGVAQLYDVSSAEWRWLCPESFTQRDAEVLCRSIVGPAVTTYDQAQPTIVEPSFFEGKTGPDRSRSPRVATGGVLGSPACNGSEIGLGACNGTLAASATTCSANRTVVICPPPVRLAGPDHRLEIYFRNAWLPIAGSYNPASLARVACRALGLPSEAARASSVGSALSGYVASPSGVCTGDERLPQHCGFSMEYVSTSWGYTALSIVCPTESTEGSSRFEGRAVTYADYTFQRPCADNWTDSNTADVRLLGPQPWRGYPQIYVDGDGWGYVCQYDWDSNDAAVAARTFGLSSDGAVRSYNARLPDQAPIRFAVAGLGCTGAEDSLTACPSQDYMSCWQYNTGDAVHLDAAPAVRFREGRGVSAGSLESSHTGQWRAVCADGFDVHAAQVACREMGLGAFNARLATETDGFSSDLGTDGSWWLTGLDCSGYEAQLSDCARPSALGQGECLSQQAAVVVCGSTSLAGWSSLPTAGLVRVPSLASGSGSTFDEQRSYVAEGSAAGEESFADIACRSAGLPTVRARPMVGSVQGCGWLYAHCEPSQSTVDECSGYPDSNCGSHQRAIGAVCPTIDLVGSADPHEGNVRIFHDGQWRSVCATASSPWTQREADVVCRELGFARADSFGTGASVYASRAPDFWLDSVSCGGSEASLLRCEHSPFGLADSACSDANVAHVRCSASRLAFVDAETGIQLPASATSGTLAFIGAEQLHLVPLSAIGTSVARRAALCTEFGVPGSVAVLTPLSQSRHCYWADVENPACTRASSSFSSCADLIPNSECKDDTAVHVTCPKVRVQGPSAIEGDVAVFRSGAWAAVCDDGWDADDAGAVCAELGLGSPEDATPTTGSAFGAVALGGYGATQVACAPGATSLDNCPAASGVAACGGSLTRVAGVRCSPRLVRLREFNSSAPGPTPARRGFLEVKMTSLGGLWAPFHHDALPSSDQGALFCAMLDLPSLGARLYARPFPAGAAQYHISNEPHCDAFSRAHVSDCLSSLEDLGTRVSNSPFNAAYLECTEVAIRPELAPAAAAGGQPRPRRPYVGVPLVLDKAGVARPACGVGAGADEAAALCREAGLDPAAASVADSDFPSRFSPAPQLACPPGATSLRNCSATAPCSPGAGTLVARCGPSLRIVNGTAHVLVGDVWVSVFASRDVVSGPVGAAFARAMCRQAGLPDAYARISTISASSGCRSGFVQLPNFMAASCHNATSLSECGVRAFSPFESSYDCRYPSGYPVALTCAPYRLLGGADLFEGDIAMALDSGSDYRPVCDLGWTDDDAADVCAALGFDPTAARATHGSLFTGTNDLPGAGGAPYAKDASRAAGDLANQDPRPVQLLAYSSVARAVPAAAVRTINFSPGFARVYLDPAGGGNPLSAPAVSVRDAPPRGNLSLPSGLSIGDTLVVAVDAPSYCWGDTFLTLELPASGYGGNALRVELGCLDDRLLRIRRISTAGTSSFASDTSPLELSRRYRIRVTVASAGFNVALEAVPVCAAGSFLNGSLCAPCPAATYARPISVISSSQAQACAPCPAGYTGAFVGASSEQAGCPFAGVLPTAGCSSGGTAGVRCGAPVRIAPASLLLQDRRVTGRVEVLFSPADGQWAPITRSNWDAPNSWRVRRVGAALAAFLGSDALATRVLNSDPYSYYGTCNFTASLSFWGCYSPDAPNSAVFPCGTNQWSYTTCGDSEFTVSAGPPSALGSYLRQWENAAAASFFESGEPEVGAIEAYCGDTFGSLYPEGGEWESPRRISCPVGCPGVTVRGTGVYHRDVSACAALRHWLGASQGWILPHGLRAAALPSPGSTLNGVLSEAADDTGPLDGDGDGGAYYGFAALGALPDFGGIRLAGGRHRENATGAGFGGSVGGSSVVGAVQVMSSSGMWRYVCADGFGPAEAATVCRHIGSDEAQLPHGARVIPSPVRPAAAALAGYHITALACGDYREHGSIRTCAYTAVPDPFNAFCATGPAAVACPPEPVETRAEGPTLANATFGALHIDAAAVRLPEFSQYAAMVGPAVCAKLGLPSVGALASSAVVGADASYSFGTAGELRAPVEGRLLPLPNSIGTSGFTAPDGTFQPHQQAHVFCPVARVVPLRGAPASLPRGTVQVFLGAEWVTVCDSASATAPTARALCGMAGYPRDGAVFEAPSTWASGADGLDGLECATGEETSVADCASPGTRGSCAAPATLRCSPAVRLGTQPTGRFQHLGRRAESGPVQVYRPHVGPEWWVLGPGLPDVQDGMYTFVADAVCSAAGVAGADGELHGVPASLVAAESSNGIATSSLSSNTIVLPLAPEPFASSVAMGSPRSDRITVGEYSNALAASCAAARLAGGDDDASGVVLYTVDGVERPICADAIDATAAAATAAAACGSALRVPGTGTPAVVPAARFNWTEAGAAAAGQLYWAPAQQCTQADRDLGACGEWSVQGSCGADGPLAVECGASGAPRGGVRVVDDDGQPTSSGGGFVQVRRGSSWFYIRLYSSTVSPSLRTALCSSLGVSETAAVVTSRSPSAAVGPRLIVGFDGQNFQCRDGDDFMPCIRRQEPGFDINANTYSIDAQDQLMHARCPRIALDGPASGRVNGRLQGDVVVRVGGQWRPICDDSFDDEDAAVVCRDLGEEPSRAVATVGSAFGTDTSFGYAMHATACTGAESSLFDCSSSVGAPPLLCPRGHAVGVRCGFRTRIEGNGLVRTSLDGAIWHYVALHHRGADFLPAARILCRAAGFATAGAFWGVRNRTMGQCTVISYLYCSGNEQEVADCAFGTDSRPCGADWVEPLVHLSCSSTRLVAPAGDPAAAAPSRGRLEAYNTDHAAWEPVCLDRIGGATQAGAAAAAAVCRSLGFDAASPTLLRGDGSPAAAALAWPFRAQCVGGERDLGDCAVSPASASDACAEVAFVECAPLVRQVTAASANPEADTTTDAGRGFLQIFMAGAWRTPSTHWSSLGSESAAVACRALGFPAVDAAVRDDQQGQGTWETRTFVDGSLGCTGSEAAPYLCDGTSVRLDDPATSATVQPAFVACQRTRLMVGGTSRSRWAGDVERFVGGVWRPVCDFEWDAVDARVVCSSIGVDLASGTPEALRGSIFGGAADAGPDDYAASNVACTGAEAALDECPSAAATAAQCPAGRAAGVRCPANVRFRSRATPRSGTVEVFLDGEWNLLRMPLGARAMAQTARVLCGTLGLPQASARFDPGPAVSSADAQRTFDFHCSGGEPSVTDCERWDWQEPSFRVPTLACPDLHLAGTDSDGGVVQHYHRGEWRSVCADAWSATEARVVCRALRKSDAAGVRAVDAGPDTAATFWLSGVRCAGTEGTLADCTYSGLDLGAATCPSRRRAAVRCTGPALDEPSWLASREARLAFTAGSVDSTEPSLRRGMLQVALPDREFEGTSFQREWRFVCRHQFDETDGVVACRSLGFAATGRDDVRVLDFGNRDVRRLLLDSEDAYAVNYRSYTAHPFDYRLFWLDDVACTGSEASILDCPLGGAPGQHNCVDEDIVAIECLGPRLVAPVPVNATAAVGVSLFSGDAPKPPAAAQTDDIEDADAAPTAGAVVIDVLGQRRYVCDDGWTDTEAGVVCAQLGFLRGGSRARRRLVPSSRTYFMDSVACAGGEASLAECTFPGWGLHDCPAGRAAGVDCWRGRTPSLNCTLDAAPLVAGFEAEFANCTANCTAPGAVAAEAARCECECLQVRYWRARLLAESPLGLCPSVAAAAGNATGTVLARVAAGGAACPLTTVPSGNYSANATWAANVTAAEEAAVAAISAFWGDWDATRDDAALCTTIRSGFSRVKLAETTLVVLGQPQTPAFQGALGLIGALNDRRSCGALLFCEPGFYPPSPGSVPEGQAPACLGCPAGTYQPLYGATSVQSCTPCPAGSASSVAAATSAATCTVCPAGRFAGAGSAACSSCPAGTYGDSEGAASASACAVCPAGTFGHPVVRAPFNESCLTCPRGTYQPAEAKTSCLSCPAGTYSNATAATAASVCRPCPAGTFSTVAALTGVERCELCPAGKFSSQPGQAEDKCVPCSLSEVAEEPGAAFCAPCVAPKYRASASRCEWCEANRVIFASQADSLQNTPVACSRTCLNGEEPSEKNEFCVKCGYGFHQPNRAQSQCVACPLGTHSDRTGQSQCQRCEVGFFANSSGLEDCTACPAGRITLDLASASHTACVCPPGGFSLDVAAYGEPCTSCPEGSRCVKGRAPAASPGYWYSLRNPTVFFPCTPYESCVGGDLAAPVVIGEDGKAASASRRRLLSVESRAYRLTLECVAAIASGNDAAVPNCTVPDASLLCSDGYTGDRCSACDEGYYRRGPACRVCPPSAAPFLVLFVIAVLVMGAIATVMLRTGVNLAAITIALEYFQILGKFGQMDLNWSSSAESGMTRFSITDFDPQFVAPECVSRNFTFQTQWLLMFALPLAFGAFFLAGHTLWALACSLCKSTTARRKVTRQRVGAFLLVLQVLYLSLVQKAMQALDCSPLPDGTAALDADPRVVCWGSEHATLIGFGILSIILYVAGIPLLFWAVLHHARKRARALDRKLLELEEQAVNTEMSRVRLVEACARRQAAAVEEMEQLIADGEKVPEDVEQDAAAVPEEQRDVIELQERLESTGKRHRELLFELELIDTTAGCLYKRFKVANSYWILVQMMRKAGIIVAFIMLTNRPMIQATMVAIVLVVALFLQLTFQPYAPFKEQSSFARYYGAVADARAEEVDEPTDDGADSSDGEFETDDEEDGAGGEAGAVGPPDTAAAAAVANPTEVELRTEEGEDKDSGSAGEGKTEDKETEGGGDEAVESVATAGAESGPKGRPSRHSLSLKRSESPTHMEEDEEDNEDDDSVEGEGGGDEGNGSDDSSIRHKRSAAKRFSTADKLELDAIEASKDHYKQTKKSLRARVVAKLEGVRRMVVSDPNAMEATALFGALLIVICGQLYRASRVELAVEDDSAEEAATAAAASADSSAASTERSSGLGSSFSFSATSFYSTGVVDAFVVLLLVSSSTYMVLLVLMPVFEAYLARKERKRLADERAGKDTDGGQQRKQRRKGKIVARDIHIALNSARDGDDDTDKIVQTTSLSALVAQARTRMLKRPNLRAPYARAGLLDLLGEAIQHMRMPVERASAIAAAAMLLPEVEEGSVVAARFLDRAAKVMVRLPRDAELSAHIARLLLDATRGNHAEAVSALDGICDKLATCLELFKSRKLAVAELSATLAKLLDQDTAPVDRFTEGACVRRAELACEILAMYEDDADIVGSTLRWAATLLRLPAAEAAFHVAVDRGMLAQVKSAVERFSDSRKVTHFGKQLVRLLKRGVNSRGEGGNGEGMRQKKKKTYNPTPKANGKGNATERGDTTRRGGRKSVV